MLGNVSYLIYIKKNAVEVYKKGIEEPALMQIPPTALYHLEVQNPILLENLLTTFIHNLNLKKQKGIIMLSPSIIFEKTIPPSPTKSSEEIIKFFEDIPLEQEEIAKKVVHLPDQTLLMGTNKSLYEKVISIFESVGWQIKAVIPSILVGEYPDESILPPEDIKHILSDSKLQKEADFLIDNQKVKQTVAKPKLNPLNEEETQQQNPKNLKQIILLVFALIFFIGAAGFFAWNNGYVQKLLKIPTGKNNTQQNMQASQSASVSQNTSQASASATQQPTIKEAKAKDKMKVQILNGSGIVGQASRVRDLLSEIGYDDFELGNASTSAEATKVEFVSEITQSLRDELTTQLEKLFAKIQTKEATTETKYDITITTGQ